MVEVNVSSLEDIFGADDTKYELVEAYGKTVKIGSLSSEDMVDWIEAQVDPASRKFAGILLLVMSLVGPDGARVPKTERAAAVELFKAKHAESNRKIIRAARHLNGLDEIGKIIDALKNEQGEASTVASPTDSPSQPAA